MHNTMKVHELIRMLQGCDRLADVEIVQFFNEHRSVEVRSMDIENGKVILKDHYVRLAEEETFKAHDGSEYTISNLGVRYLAKQSFVIQGDYKRQ